jgi:hypothetical protein
MLEILLPEYTKQLLENYQNIFSQLASQLRWLYFDEAFRLVIRVGYLDDGWIRLKLDGHWEFTGELLREMSWGFYSIAEVGKNVDMLKNALASIGTDKLRVSVVDTLPRSPFYLTDSTGNELSSYIKNIDTAISSFTGSPGGSVPARGVVILGYDGTYLRIVKVTSDGRLLATLG